MVAGCPSEGPLSAEDMADRMLAAHGKSFHWARRFLGPVAARQATLLYAFCRFLDDIADGDLPGGLPRLRAIDMALIDGIVGDLPPDMAEVATFLALSQEAAIPRAAARDLIAGLIFDQGTVALEDQAALIVYAYQVAGTVGLMMAPILGRRDRRADAFAVDLGIAMQLTNIARDVAEDAGLGRRYLPASWCGALTPAEIAAGMRDPADPCRAPVATAVGETLVWAETYYASGLAGLAYLPWQNDLAMGVAATVYRAIGRRLTRRHHAWWRGRQVVGGGGKVLASAASLPRLVRRWRMPPAHNAALHAPLRGIASVDALS